MAAMLAIRAKAAQAQGRAQNSRPADEPMTTDTKARRQAERQQRLQQALRENLRRRKAQARGRVPSEPVAVEREVDATEPAGNKRSEE